MESSLRADAWALERIRAYSNGKILIWAWVSRGLVDLDWVASIHFGGNLQACKDAMAAVTGKIRELVQLDHLPLVDGAPDSEPTEPKQVIMDGGMFTFWAFSESKDSEPIALPMWMRGAIDKCILQWRSQLTKWTERIAKRAEQGKTDLPPKQQRVYNEWNKTKTRSIVLDKTKKAEVLNVGSKSVSALKKHCLLLVVL